MASSNSTVYIDDDIVILDAYRTPIGNLNGCFSTLKAHQLGGVVIKRILEECNVQHDDIDEVVMGQALTSAQGQNPARQAAVSGGLPYSVPAYGVSFLCGSGLKAVANAYQSIKAGDASMIIAGGQESMTNAPHAIHMRNGVKLGDANLVDTMLKDGLMDSFYDYHMGITAENVAKQWNISREEQDTYAVECQKKIGIAQKESAFETEITPVVVQDRKSSITISADEFPKPDTSLESLSRLRPAFIRDGTGTVTAGNASGINDGAACVMVANFSKVHGMSLKQPMARIVCWAQVGIDPSIMGSAPIEAVKKALSKANWDIGEVDLFELNEAFAAQSIAVVRDLGIPADKVNVSGGALGLGHPIGASGCRILVTLLHNMKRMEKKRGVAALCIGGGMGIAMCVERLNVA